MSNPSDLTQEDLSRIVTRDNFVKAQLTERVAALVRENLELLSIIQEIQQDLADLRQSQQVLTAANGEIPAVVQQPAPQPSVVTSP